LYHPLSFDIRTRHLQKMNVFCLLLSLSLLHFLHAAPTSSLIHFSDVKTPSSTEKYSLSASARHSVPVSFERQEIIEKAHALRPTARGYLTLIKAGASLNHAPLREDHIKRAVEFLGKAVYQYPPPRNEFQAITELFQYLKYEPSVLYNFQSYHMFVEKAQFLTFIDFCGANDVHLYRYLSIPEDLLKTTAVILFHYNRLDDIKKWILPQCLHRTTAQYMSLPSTIYDKHSQQTQQDNHLLFAKLKEILKIYEDTKSQFDAAVRYDTDLKYFLHSDSVGSYGETALSLIKSFEGPKGRDGW